MDKKNIYCEITIGSHTEDHLSQITAGYEMLRQKGLLTYSLRLDTNYIKNKYIHRAIVEVIIGDKILVYDLADGYQSFFISKVDKELRQIDFYFKRSYSGVQNSHLLHHSKVYPLGLNYHVSCYKNPYDKYFNTKGLKGQKLLRDYVFYLRSKKRFVEKFYYKNFENKNRRPHDKYNVLFNCRLYNPDSIKMEGIRAAYPFLLENEIRVKFEEWREDFYEVTRQRMNTVKVLKDSFSTRFIGGISSDDYSQKVAPDLLLDNNVYMKFNYLDHLKQNNICISTKGLHGSIGWKFAEYVAAGRAIVTDSLNYEVPGDFRNEKNYQCFTDENSLVNIVESLLNDTQKIHKMEDQNNIYYENFLRPDKIVLNSLKTAKIL